MSGSSHRGLRCNQRSPLALAAVAIVASAGSLAPLIELLSGISPRCPAAILVAMHTGPQSILASLLSAHSPLHVKNAQHRERVRSGIVYVAPPERHVLVNADRTLSVVERERIRFVRPSGDWLLNSVAGSYADMGIAVILSGYRDDGARGALNVVRAGGEVIVQAPQTCKVPEMPSAALRMTGTPSVLAPAEIATALNRRLAGFDFDREWRRFEDPFAA